MNTKPIKWRLHLPVAPAIVFRALDTNEGRAQFWAQSAVERHGMIHFEFINGQTWQAKIIERREASIFAIDYFGATARFELTADGAGGTDVVLTHAGVSENDWHETHAGWLNVLLILKAWVVTGVDIRNHDANRTWDQGYVDQ